MKTMDGQEERIWAMWSGKLEMEGLENLAKPDAFIFTDRETEAQGGEETCPRPGVSL